MESAGDDVMDVSEIKVLATSLFSLNVGVRKKIEDLI